MASEDAKKNNMAQRVVDDDEYAAAGFSRDVVAVTEDDDVGGTGESLDNFLRHESQMRDSPHYDPSKDAVAIDRARISAMASPLLAGGSSSDPAHNVFLFVNPTSGGNKAAAFMECGLEYIRLTCPEPVNLWIWDIRQGTSGAKPGFIKLKFVVDNLHVVEGGRRTCSTTEAAAGGVGAFTTTVDGVTTDNETGTDNTDFDVRVAGAAAGAGAAAPGPRSRSGVNSGLPNGVCGFVCPDDVVYVIVCGGDGTVMWAVTEIWAHGIDDARIALGVVPYGTGNDFARALGWQGFNAAEPYAKHFKVLQQLIGEWLRASIVFHDIWDVTLKVHNDGAFMKIDSASRKKKAVAGVRPVVNNRELTKSISTFVAESGPQAPMLCNMSARILSLKMCNYFSIGIESRIGVGFDRYRTTSQFWNKLRYGVEGGKKAFFRGITPLNGTIKKLEEEIGDKQTRILFDNENGSATLRSKTRSLIASNIPSFAAGLDVWGPSRNSGLQAGAKIVKNETVLNHQQKMGDGQLEFVSFSTVAQMGIERAFHGRGKRVGAGRGPFVFEFADNDEISNGERSYFQVDGEFFIMTRPERITIRHRRHIKVLCQADLARQKSEMFTLCG